MTFDEAWENLKSKDPDAYTRAEQMAADFYEAIQYAYDQGFKSGYELGKSERPIGKPCIVTSDDDMSNYYICPCCRKPIDVWDRYCKHCGAKMEAMKE